MSDVVPFISITALSPAVSADQTRRLQQGTTELMVSGMRKRRCSRRIPRIGSLQHRRSRCRYRRACRGDHRTGNKHHAIHRRFTDGTNVPFLLLGVMMFGIGVGNARVILSENRYPPRIKSGAGFFGSRTIARPQRSRARMASAARAHDARASARLGRRPMS